MTLVLDALLIASFARELDAHHRGARLRALRLDRTRRALDLLFREGTLHLGLDPEAAAIAWSDPLEPGSGDRPLSARLRAASALPDDRVLVLSFARVRGSPSGVDVILEWISNRWNAVVTEGADRVVRHVLIERAGERAARSGYPWTPPVPSAREGVDGTLTRTRWRELLGSVAPERRQRTLMAHVAWTSPVNTPALLGSVGRAHDESALDPGHLLWQELAATALGTADARPVTWPTEDGAQPYPMPLPGTDGEPASSLLDAFTRAAVLVSAVPPAIAANLIAALEGLEVRAWARVDALGRELADAPDPAELRGTADLLLARLGEVVHGAERARLLGFDGVPVEIVLDPTCSPQENASAYYERAARAERARARLPGLVAAAEREAHRIARLLADALAGAVTEEALRAELPPSDEATGSPEAPSLPYRIYRSSGGLEIRVGKGARQNDALTFHHAAPDDVWMHARHAAGAHVVLRWHEDANPPARDLAEAASLAALHSKARTSGSVPIDWTRRKYVRKPRKSPPGQVLVERAKTLFVAPDPALEERLRT